MRKKEGRVTTRRKGCTWKKEEEWGGRGEKKDEEIKCK